MIHELPPLRTEDLGKIRETTARTIAVLLLRGFIVLMALPFCYLLVYVVLSPKPDLQTAAALVSQTTEMIKTVSAVLSGLVGAVLFYYFGAERRGG